jgi:hypothetical protein
MMSVMVFFSVSNCWSAHTAAAWIPVVIFASNFPFSLCSIYYYLGSSTLWLLTSYSIGVSFFWVLLLGAFDCNKFWCLCEIRVDRSSSSIDSLTQDQRKNKKNSHYKRVWSPDSENTKAHEHLTLKCLSCASKDLWGGRLCKETRR